VDVPCHINVEPFADKIIDQVIAFQK
jgi:hypothetical protein